MQVSAPDQPQQAMKLIDRQYSGGRIVDSRRQCFNCYIDDHAKSKGWVLLDCTLRAERYLRPQDAIIYPCCVAIQAEQRFTDSHEVTDARDKLDDPVRPVSQRDKRLLVSGQHDC